MREEMGVEVQELLLSIEVLIALFSSFIVDALDQWRILTRALASTKSGHCNS